jgi:hypothetical protein
VSGIDVPPCAADLDLLNGPLAHAETAGDPGGGYSCGQLQFDLGNLIGRQFRGRNASAGSVPIRDYAIAPIVRKATDKKVIRVTARRIVAGVPCCLERTERAPEFQFQRETVSAK